MRAAERLTAPLAPLSRAQRDAIADALSRGIPPSMIAALLGRPAEEVRQVADRRRARWER